MNKGDDMRNLVREPLLANIHNNLESYIMCCIPVFPFYFSADFFIYILLEDNWNNEQGFGNCLLLISCILMIACYAVFRYSLKCYIKKNAAKYNLFLTLGIANSDFWKILIFEYCPAFLFLIIFVILFSFIISNSILSFAFGELSTSHLLASMKLMGVLLFLFGFVMLGTLFILRWKQRRFSLLDYLENINNGKEDSHRFRVVYSFKIYIAIVCFVVSFGLMTNYSVGKMIVAVLLHVIGVYYLLQINGRSIKRFFSNKKQYYKDLLEWVYFISEYRLNGNAICAVYAVNLLFALVFGGLFASDLSSNGIHIAVSILLIVLGLSIIFEGQTIILERLFWEIKNEKIQHEILFYLGISISDYNRFLHKRARNLFIFPGGVASIMGTFFFICDYIYQEDVTSIIQLASFEMIKYIIMLFAFWLFQWGGYIYARNRITKENILI